VILNSVGKKGEGWIIRQKSMVKTKGKSGQMPGHPSVIVANEINKHKNRASDMMLEHLFFSFYANTIAIVIL